MSILHFRHVVVGLALCAAGTAAAQDGTSPPTGPAAAPAAADAPRVDRSRLTREDLARHPDGDLLSLIQGQRPQWLRVRGRSSLNRPEPQVWVYRDGIRIGGVGALRQIQISTVREVQFLDGSQATQRFGLDHGSGAIQITSR